MIENTKPSVLNHEPSDRKNELSLSFFSDISHSVIENTNFWRDSKRSLRQNPKKKPYFFLRCTL
ncbi:hypothetical protein CL689_06035 [Candidatus Saccharibacteria bacterium]|nr:hypothetical protein [Candidatus Saccharibacteria bacterium]